MKTVTGEVTSSAPIALSKAASILCKFVSAENGVSQAFGAYLRRASASFNELVQLHREIRPSSSLAVGARSHRKKHRKDYESEITVEEELPDLGEPGRPGTEAHKKKKRRRREEKGEFENFEDMEGEMGIKGKEEPRNSCVGVENGRDRHEEEEKEKFDNLGDSEAKKGVLVKEEARIGDGVEANVGEDSGKKKYNKKKKKEQDGEKSKFENFKSGNSGDDGVRIGIEVKEEPRISDEVEGDHKKNKKKRKDVGDVSNFDGNVAQNGDSEREGKILVEEEEEKPRTKRKSVEVEEGGNVGTEEQTSKKKKTGKSGDDKN